MRFQRDLITTLANLIIILCVLTGCARATMETPVLPTLPAVMKNLPSVVRFAHSGDAMELMWYKEPFSGTYDELLLKADGVIAHQRVIENWAIHGPVTGQLSEADKQEVRAILDKLRNTSSDTASVGSTFISLGFSWRSDSQVIYYSNLTCTDELRHLIQIADTAFLGNPDEQSVLNNLCASDTQNTEPTPTANLLKNLIFPSTQTPDPHRIKLFTVSWSTQTLTNTYEMLSLYSDNSIFYSSGVGDKLLFTLDTHVNDADRKIVRDSLESMADLNTVVEAAKTTITLSFPWEGDYHIASFNGSQCPNGLQRLFDLAKSIFERESPGSIKISNPCNHQ